MLLFAFCDPVVAGSVLLVVIIVDFVVAIVAPAPCGSPGVCKLL